MKSTFTLFILLSILQHAYSQNCHPDPNARTEVTSSKGVTSYICHIVVNRRTVWPFTKGWPATASFIAPNVITGAGHSFAEGRGHTKILGLDIYIGQHRENGKDSVLVYKHYDRDSLVLWCDSRFAREGNADYDYAYAALPANLASSFFKPVPYDSIQPLIDSVHLTGYPADKPDQLWEKSAAKSNINNGPLVLQYGMYTQEGDSGAPIWSNISGQYFLVGIHGTGKYKNGCNAAVKLTADRLLVMREFVLRNHIP